MWKLLPPGYPPISWGFVLIFILPILTLETNAGSVNRKPLCTRARSRPYTGNGLAAKEGGSPCPNCLFLAPGLVSCCFNASVIVYLTWGCL